MFASQRYHDGYRYRRVRIRRPSVLYLEVYQRTSMQNNVFRQEEQQVADEQQCCTPSVRYLLLKNKDE